MVYHRAERVPIGDDFRLLLGLLSNQAEITLEIKLEFRLQSAESPASVGSFRIE